MAFLYILGAYVCEEFHPFSHFPMYNSIPNWSYAFYFVDENNSLITCNRLNTRGGKLGHLYSTIAEYNKVPFGSGTESPQQLKLIGEKMTQQILTNVQHPLKVKKIKLVRVYYHFNQDKLVSKLQCIYEKTME
jgi:hypothetical protein